MEVILPLIAPLPAAQSEWLTVVKVQKREIAVLLSNGKEESARIKVEHVIRQDYEIECFELIQLYLELLLERVRIITHDDTCPHELLVPVATVLWCADRIDIEELQQVKRQFGLKYGSKFVKECAENESLMVSDKVITKLSIRPPTAYLVQEYLKVCSIDLELPTCSEDICGCRRSLRSTRYNGRPNTASFPTTPPSSRLPLVSPPQTDFLHLRPLRKRRPLHASLLLTP